MKMGRRLASAIRWVTLLAIIQFTEATNCPEKCVCQWRNGLPTADCSNLNLTAIPSNIPPNILVLDLSGNQIPHIKNSTFLINNLAHILKLDLSHSQIETIDSSAFMGMSNLRELNLDGNNFEEFLAAPFVGIPNLRVLSLRFNRLKTIPNYAFKTLNQLETLDLQSSQINQIDPEGFHGLENLRSLQLNGNQLRRLTLSVLSPLKALQQLDLHENPWHCDCRVRELLKWMKIRQVGSGYRTTCQTPEQFRAIDWDTIPKDKLACAPEILSSEAYNIIPGQNISAECAVFGDPSPKVTWLHNGVPINFDQVNNSKYETYSQNLSSHIVHILIIRNASHASDAGHYQCLATNWVGNATGHIMLFQPAGIFSPTGITILLIALITAITLVGLVVFCRKRKCGFFIAKAKELSPDSEKGLKNSKSQDTFSQVSYYKPPTAHLVPPQRNNETTLLMSLENDTEPKDKLSGSDGSNSPTCYQVNETLPDHVADRLSNGNNDEDKDSGIQHEESDGSVRNESSAGNGIYTPQDIFTDSDHESVAKSTRTVTFSPNTCFTPSSARRSPAPKNHSLAISNGYDPFLGTAV